MGIVNNVLAGASGNQGYFLTRSLRFRSSASANLTRTPSSTGNRKTWTWSAWIKRGALTQTGTIWGSNFSSGGFGLAFGNYGGAGVNPEYIGVTLYAVGTVTTNAVFRDPSAWYHIVARFDSTQATQANRFILYVNGVQQTLSGTLNVTLNADYNVNLAGALHVMAGESGYFNDLYMAEVNFVDGQYLAPSAFGQTSPSTGVWEPKKYGGSYGTNGFYLPFTDNSNNTATTIGKDFSGNGNNWTPNNISVTAGVTYDSMTDVPTLTSPTAANYCVWNAIAPSGSSTFSNGNLTGVVAAGGNSIEGTFAPTSGKWYWEYTYTNGSATACIFGVTQTTAGNSGITAGNGVGYYSGDGTKYIGAANTAYGASFGYGTVIGVALDLDGGTVTFYRNNVSQGAISLPAAGSVGWKPCVQNGTGAGTQTADVTFGQRPFTYTPPSGFVALNTFNLPTPTIGATPSSQANKYFDATTYTGNGGTQVITNSGSMQPDFVWIKTRSTSQNHSLIDAVRGNTKILYSDLTNAENTFSGVLDSFNSNGFTLGSSASVNQNGTTFVGWQWRASNATGVTNTAGSITSTVSANTTAGFSVVTYTGTGTTATIGHGLGVAPSMIITKNRTTGGTEWIIYHASLGATKGLYFNTSAAATTVGFWNNTAPTSSVFTVYGGNDSNTNGNATVAYCFSEVAGYSKFGSYTGNGSSDGTFVFTGFRPRYVLFKVSSTSASWVINDSARNTYNVEDLYLIPNNANAEGTLATVDFLSNGFKLRTTDTSWNQNGATYIYAAFAENPFKYSLAR